MRGRLGEILWGNASLKLISLALALLLFALVRSEKEAVTQGTVQLSYSAPPKKLLASKSPSQLRISVVGPASRMQRFRTDDVADVHIDLAGVPEGYFEFGKDLINLPWGLKVSSIRPAGFRVQYMDISQRTLQVKATVQGQVATGFQVIKQWVRPAQIKVSGPAKEVDALAGLSTRPVSVDNAKANIVQEVELMPLPAGVRATTSGKLKVTVQVSPIISEVSLPRVPVRFSDPAGRKGRPEPTVVEVTISGPTKVVAKLHRAGVSALVQAKETVEGTARVTPTIKGLPEGVKVIRVNPAKVAVTIIKDPPPPAPTEHKGPEPKK